MSPARTSRAMWTCPDCGRTFVQRNQAHACQTTSVGEHLAGKSDLAVAIYRAVEAALARSGEFRVHPQKTRIGFITRMTFAGLTLARRWADLAFILPGPVDSPRIRRLTLYGPTSFAHTVRLHSAEEVDEEVASWLAEARRRGDQDTLDPTATSPPLRGRLLEIVTIPFLGKVEPMSDSLVVRLPGYATEVLALANTVSVRAAGVIFRTSVVTDSKVGSYVVIDPAIDVRNGETIDVTLRAG